MDPEIKKPKGVDVVHFRSKQAAIAHSMALLESEGGGRVIVWGRDGEVESVTPVVPRGAGSPS